MSKILVPPTVLLAVSDQFAKASDHLEMTKNTLNQQISMMMFTWDGTTRQRFFADFQGARSEMKLTIEHMRVISQELKDIAYKFLAVDSETGELDPRCMAPIIPAPGSGSGVIDDGPKTWEDHAEELWKGAVSGAKILADSITGTVDALIEDPLGTGGQMAYDATIGTVEEVIDTTVWGTKMIFDVGDTRERFDEKLNAEQDKINEMGMSQYLGEKGAIILGGAALRRVGVKNKPALKHDSGGDGGGPPKKAEGTGDIKQDMLNSPASEKWGVLEDGTNQGIKHFADYWEKYPERIPSLAKRLGVDETHFENSVKGFENFTVQVERVMDNGKLREVNGKQIYYLDGAENPKKGVVVIVKDGKVQSMMPSDPKSFEKLQ